MAQKLFFLLISWKMYPSYDVLGFLFDMDHSRACTNVHTLWPVLKRTLQALDVLPAREFASIEDFRAACADIADLLIDATERPHARPQDETAQREKYSGKKKRHTVKNTVIATTWKWIVFLGYTVAGKTHDYTQFKTEFPMLEGEGEEALAAWIMKLEAQMSGNFLLSNNSTY